MHLFKEKINMNFLKSIRFIRNYSNSARKQCDKCIGNKWNLSICQDNRLNTILNDSLRWTFQRAQREPKPSPQSAVRKPHAVRVIGPFFPVWCTAVVSGTFPTPDYTITPEKHRQRSRTVRHNRADQAEVTTPYPAPRFSGRYSGV